MYKQLQIITGKINDYPIQQQV